MSKKLLITISDQEAAELNILRDLIGEKTINKTIRDLIQITIGRELIGYDEYHGYKVQILGKIGDGKPNHFISTKYALDFFHRHADKYLYKNEVENWQSIRYSLKNDINRYTLDKKKIREPE